MSDGGVGVGVAARAGVGAGVTASGPFVDWVTGGFTARFRIADDQPVALVSFVPAGVTPADGPAVPQPLVEVTSVDHGRFPGGFRHVDSTIGARLRHDRHEASDDATDSRFRVWQTDAATGLQTESVFEARAGVPAFRTRTVVTAGRDAVVLDFVSSFASGAFLVDAGVDVDDLTLTHAENDWAAESRWRTSPLRDIGMARIDREGQHHPPRSRCVVQNRGSWSTGEALPIGLLRAPGYGLVWEVVHNGPWLYELGETRSAAYLALSGPTGQEHQWAVRLEPGESWESVPVTVGLAAGASGSGAAGVDQAFAVLTDTRRAFRQVRTADAELPLVFNDYMNTLMGDPTTAKLLPLIDAAADAGADLFCIDAGWYAEGHWWDTVGAWEPAASRFPGGIEEVLDHVRARGMTPGLWLEPEVVGVHSPLASTLPDSAFVQRDGVRVAEHGRHLLDLRSPEARAHLGAVVDRLVGELGVGFFKMDYNTMTGPLPWTVEQSRALLDWVDDVQARYPALRIEGCASGAMRADQAMLGRLHMQSTSDQQDPVLYATIAAAAPAAMLPEQAGNWAYPAVDMDEDRFVLSLVNGVLGRMYLSGYLNEMSDDQLGLVRDAVAAQRAVLPVLASAHPVWPLGLPAWEDTEVAMGLTAPDGTLFLSVWALAGGDPIAVPLDVFRGRGVAVTPLFPTDLGSWSASWDAAAGVLSVGSGTGAPSARVFRLRAEEAGAEDAGTAG